MGFTAIEPVNVAAPGVLTIRTVKSKAGWRLMLSIPSVCMIKAKWFNPPTTLLALIGDGSDAGKLLLKEEDKGQEGKGIKVTVMKHTCLMRLPIQDWMPQLEFEPAAVDPVVYGEKQIVLTLPEWAWNKDRQKAIEIVRKQKQAQDARVAPRAVPNR